MKLLSQLLLTVMVLFASWESFVVVGWLATLPSDLAILASLLSCMLTIWGAVKLVYLIWKKEISKCIDVIAENL